MASDEVTNRREEAQKALAGKERYANLAEKEQVLVRRRQEAVRAMEGENHRKQRETKEKTEQSRRQAAELEAKKRQAAEATEQQRLAAEAKAAEQKKTAELEAKNKRLTDIERGTKTIEQLRSSAGGLSPIRTYKSDFAQAIKTGGMSAAKIAMSEQVKRVGIKEAAEAASNRGPSIISRISVFFFTIILLGAIGGLGYLAWSNKTPEGAPPPGVRVPEPLIFVENNLAIDLSQDGLDAPSPKILTDRATDTIGPEQLGITQLYFIKNRQVLTFSAIRQILELDMPSRVSRNLKPGFMFGNYNDGQEQQRFLILEVSVYEQVFSGLLEWEQSMVADLLPLLYSSARVNLVAGRSFKDKRIKNKDVRQIASAEGETFLLYAFLDNNHVVITTDEGVFEEVFERFTNS